MGGFPATFGAEIHPTEALSVPIPNVIGAALLGGLQQTDTWPAFIGDIFEQL